MIKGKTFYFLRHGETDWNREGRLQGQTDVPLNVRGHAQALAAAEILRSHGIATICTSPLARAYHTARIVEDATGAAIAIVDGLAEVCLGDWQGEVPAETWRERRVRWRAGEAAPPDGESYRAFATRAVAALNEALRAPAPVLIVSHGGIYGAFETALGFERQGLANAVPIRHDPPAGEDGWRRVVLDGARTT